jgi:ABC-type branched-subunit amino acid transport system ATPase component
MPLEFPIQHEQPLLDVRDVVIRFGDTIAVQGLDLTIRRCETLALV